MRHEPRASGFRAFRSFCFSRRHETDLRFPDEANAVRDMGGLIVRIERPGLEAIAASGHASETALDAIKPDLTIVNHFGSVKELQKYVTERLGQVEFDADLAA
jgi:hypothetical protein